MYNLLKIPLLDKSSGYCSFPWTRTSVSEICKLSKSTNKNFLYCILCHVVIFILF